MADKNQDNGNQEVGYGIPEAAAGLVGGGTAAHFTGKSLSAARNEALPEIITEAGRKAEETFRRNNAGMAAEELTAGINAAVKIAKEPFSKELNQLNNPLVRPYAAFKGASTLGKVGMGAAVVASALGAAWAINAIRNIGRDKSHVEQLEAQGNNSQGHQR